jgi:hypothetical protein
MRIIKRVPIRPDPVVLKRGAILEVSGYAESKDKLLDEIFPQVPSVWPALEDVWQRAGDGRLISRRIPEGEISMRLFKVVKEGKVFFSDDIVFIGKAEQTNSFHLQLKPGLGLSGKLDGAVPRPVVNGRVIIEVISKAVITSGWPLKWHAWTPIDADGTFALKSLPPGKLEIVGICEGYLSQDGAPGPGGHRIPQSFDLDGDKTVELAMEPAGTCEITVVDEAGNPVEGATATFWPNVTWGGTASTIFCSDTYATLDVIRSKSAYPWWETRYDPLGGFRGKSDKRGIAVVRNLPPGQRAVALVHPQYEIPIRKSANNRDSGERQVLVGIMPETTSKVTVKVQKKGKEFLEPSR